MKSCHDSQLFTSQPKLSEHKIVDKVYYCCLLSRSTQVIDLLFTELEQISIKLLDNGQDLLVISDTIIRHQKTLCMSPFKEQLCCGLLNLIAGVMGHILKKDYSDYLSGKESEKLQYYSSLIRCIFVPIVETCYKALYAEKSQTIKYGKFKEFIFRI